MQNMLIALFIWILKQRWFQLALMKFVTKSIESLDSVIGKDASTDKMLIFIKRNKRSLSSIVNKEIKIGEHVFDERFLNAIKKS